MTELFLTLGVATAFVMGVIGYSSGSSPEWIVLKSTAGLLIVSALGRVLASTMSSGQADRARATGGATGTNLDMTLPEAAPVEAADKDVPEVNSAAR